MSTPVSEALCIQWENVSNVLVSTASTTQSSALPAGTVAQESPDGQIQIVNKPRDLPGGDQTVI